MDLAKLLAKSFFVTSEPVNIAELQDHLSECIPKVASGHSLTLCRRNKLIAKIQPIQSSGSPSALGEVEGWLDDDHLFLKTWISVGRFLGNRNAQTRSWSRPCL